MTSALSAGRISVLSKLMAIEPRLPTHRTTTAAGNAGGTTIECDHLGFRADDSFNDIMWAILPQGATGSSTLEVQRVSDFDQDDGSGNTIVTVYDAFSAQVSSGADFYMSAIHPEAIRLAINNATSKVYPYAFIPRQYHHISNSRVFNGLFDYWNTTSLPEWWKSSSANITVTQDKTAPYIGEYNMKLVETAGAAQYMSTDPVSPSYLQLDDGDALTLHAMLYAESASAIGVSIQDGGGVETIVYHSGTAGWEEVITASSTIQPSRPGTAIEFRVDIAASKTGYVGAVWTEGSTALDTLHIPPQFKRSPANIRQAATAWPDRRQDFSVISGYRTLSRYPAVHPSAADTIGNSVRFDTGDVSTTPHLMSIEGEDYIDEATLETDVYAVDAPFDELLWIEAIIELKNGGAQLTGSGGSAVERQLAIDWVSERDRIIEQPQSTMTQAPRAIQPILGPPSFAHYTTAEDR